MSLTGTQRAILTAAAEHPEHLAYPPERLPAGARQKVAQALLKQDLVIGVHRPAYDAIAQWTVEGEEMLLKITDDGLRAVGIDPNAGDAPEQVEQSAASENPAQEAPTAPLGGPEPAAQADDSPTSEAAQSAPQAPAEAVPVRQGAMALRSAATALLAAWDAPERAGLEDAMTALRKVLADKPARQARAPRDPATPRKPREGTKQEQVLALLRRAEGDHRRHRRRHRLAAAHGPRLLRRPQEAPGHRHRGDGARPPGRARQAGQPRLLQHLPHRRCRLTGATAAPRATRSGSTGFRPRSRGIAVSAWRRSRPACAPSW